MALRAPKICYSAARLLNLLCFCTLVGGEAPGDSSASTANFNCTPLLSARRYLLDITYLRTGPTFRYVSRRTDRWRPSAHTDTNAAGSPTAYRSPQAVCKAPSRGVFLFCSWWVEGISCQSLVQLRFGKL